MQFMLLAHKNDFKSWINMNNCVSILMTTPHVNNRLQPQCIGDELPAF